MNSTSPSEKPVALCLREIANWQLAPDPHASFRVDLPKLQRGFVWEPSKIIDLWDSLLRGFPVGSLLLSEINEKTTKENYGGAEKQAGKHWLLDGQQRATSIAMGFYDPWQNGAEADNSPKEKLWSLKKIPTLWLDLLPNKQDETKLFYPFLVTQSHPWGYNHDGGVLPWGVRGAALKKFGEAIGGENYTDYPLTAVFPWMAGLPVPVSFLLDCVFKIPESSDAEFSELLWKRCIGLLPQVWRLKFEEHWARIATDELPKCRKAVQSLKDYRIHLNYLKQSTTLNDTITSDDNSILFVRLNTGGTPLGGEELIFSLFKSVFPEAKDAVEKAAIGFMAPSRLFSLFVRLVAAGDDPSKLHEPVRLGKFKQDIATDAEFRERLHAFVEDLDNEKANLMHEAEKILTGIFPFSLPQALATRTINAAPDVFLVLLYWLKQGGTVMAGSAQHRAILGCFTALSWFTAGNAKQKRENLKRWMAAIGRNDIQAIWSSTAILPLFTKIENPIPGFPDPDALQDFLTSEIVESSNYKWDTFCMGSPSHKIWDAYTHIPRTNESSENSEASQKQIQVVQDNLSRFLDILCHCKALLLYAQRDFVKEAFAEFGQWEFALQDSNCPWDWDHIFPSAHGRWRVEAKYKDWHNTIGNLRAEKLSDNRSNQDDSPHIKLVCEMVRRKSFISNTLWDKIKKSEVNYRENDSAKELCWIILTRMNEIYREWYSSLGIKDLLSDARPSGMGAPTSQTLQ
jgi:hypothetical protein